MDRFIIKKPRLEKVNKMETSSNDQLQLQYSYPSSSEPFTSTACIGDCVEVSESIPLKSSEYANNDIVLFVGKSNIGDVDKEMLIRRAWEPLPSPKCHVQVIG